MSDVALKFKSMRTTHRYSSDWLAWFLTQHADWYGEKCWLFLPKGAKDATGRIVLVAHIDTVHDGYRRGIVKSTKVEIPVKEEEKTFAERKVADVLNMNVGKPRMVSGAGRGAVRAPTPSPGMKAGAFSMVTLSERPDALALRLSWGVSPIAMVGTTLRTRTSGLTRRSSLSGSIRYASRKRNTMTGLYIMTQ